MKRLSGLFVLLLSISFVFLSCEQTKNPVEPTSKAAADGKVNKIGVQTSATLQAAGPYDIDLNGFHVHFGDTTYEGGRTTFYYTVTYTVTADQAQIAFRLKSPPGTPSAWSPTTNVTFSPDQSDCDINPGIEWNPATSQVTYEFSVSYTGRYEVGTIRASVKSKSNNITDCKDIAGVGSRVYDISGVVFSDADGDGVYDTGDESGIRDALIRLRDSWNNEISTTTGNDGRYTFIGIPGGSYTVEVDESTVASTTSKYLQATTSTDSSINLDQDLQGINFGFSPRTRELIRDLKFGDLPTNGLTAGFWKKQFQVALTGSGKAVYDATALTSFLEQIHALLLECPFPFPSPIGNDDFQNALNILGTNSKDPILQLEKQLLATELNQVAGLGIVGADPELQLTLIAWGESLVAPSCPAASLSIHTKIRPSVIAGLSSPYSDAITIFSGISSSGGGSGGGGGD